MSTHRILGLEKTRGNFLGSGIRTSLSKGNFRVINELKTVKALKECLIYNEYSFEVNAVGKEFSEAKRAYLAGFLDADGAIMACIEKHPEKKYRFRVRVIVKITQKERKVLDWFVNEYQIGKVVRNRTTYDWIVKDQKLIRDVLHIVKPYLQVKRDQAEYALEIINGSIVSSQDLIRMAQLGDALSRSNVRSANRRKNYAVTIQESCLP